MNAVHEAEIVDFPVAQTGSFALQHKAELEAMVDTAHRYPRNIKKFEDEAVSMATIDSETAGSMFYVLRRGGTPIEGPSVRLAEIIATAWGNLRFGAKIVDVGDKTITAEGFCFDCEKNTGCTVQISRRITNKDGKRFTDDMITVTGNAACSIAQRNAITKVVPRAYIDKVYRAAKKVVTGNAKPLDQRRHDAIAVIGKLGVETDRILRAINRPSVKDITVDDIETLVGLYNAVRDGEQSIEDAFPADEAETPADAAEKATAAPSTADAVRGKLGKKKGNQANPEASGEDAELSDLDAVQLAKYNELYAQLKTEGYDPFEARDEALRRVRAVLPAMVEA